MKKERLFSLIGLMTSISICGKIAIANPLVPPPGYKIYMPWFPGAEILQVHQDFSKYYFWDWTTGIPKKTLKQVSAGEIIKKLDGVIMVNGDYFCMLSDLELMNPYPGKRISATCTSKGWKLNWIDSR